MEGTHGRKAGTIEKWAPIERPALQEADIRRTEREVVRRKTTARGPM